MYDYGFHIFIINPNKWNYELNKLQYLISIFSVRVFIRDSNFNFWLDFTLYLELLDLLGRYQIAY